ncbi:MAG: DUF6020 family protein [Lachnospiraceae bacterium]|nr:DUF6020 family protein [Lachnospiraceae bacterium]
MKMNGKSIMIKSIQSFFSVWALMKACRMQPGNILTFVFFLLCFFFFCHIDDRLPLSGFEKGRRTRLTAGFLSFLFSALYMAVDYRYYIEELTSPLFRIGIISFVLIGFLILFYNLLLLLFSYTGDKEKLDDLLFETANSHSGVWFRSSGRLSSLLNRFTVLYQNHAGVCSFFLYLLCWLPYFLYQYPGIMTPDSINQLEQVLHVIPYSNHHPWMHTLLIGVFYNLGYKLTGNMVTAMSFYTFFQLCLLAFAASYLIATMRQYRFRPLVCLIVTLFFALVPYHGVFSVTVWKDIPFAAGVMLFNCSMLRLIQKCSSISFAVFALSGLVICLFRSNGWYAFCLCLPFLLFTFGKKSKTFIPVLLGIFAAALLIKYPVMNAFQVTQPDSVESLAIPVQQVAAVLCSDRPLTENQRELIENVIDLTYIKELYNPYYADNIKELIRAGHPEYLTDHKKEFLHLWLDLGLAYPGDYLTAYINETYGYWYPDSFYLVAEAEGVSATDLGVSHTPLIRGPLVVKAKEIAIKLGSTVPIYGTLWSMGVICWIFLFCIGNAFVRNEKKKLILYLPGAALLLTVLIATPVATEFRYVYFLVFGLPFYLVCASIRLPDTD